MTGSAQISAPPDPVPLADALSEEADARAPAPAASGASAAADGEPPPSSGRPDRAAAEPEAAPDPASWTSAARGGGEEVVGETFSLPAFALYIAREAGRPLWRALALMGVSNLSESLSLVLVVPLIGLLTPGAAGVVLKTPARLARLLPLPASVHLDLGAALCGFVVLIGLRGVASRAKDLAVTDLLYRMINGARLRLFSALSGARWAYLSRLRASDLNHAVNADVERMQIAAMQLIQLAQSVLMVAVYGTVSLLVSARMTAFALLLGGGVLAALRPLRRRAGDYGRTFLYSRRDQYAVVGEFLGGMKLAKAFNVEAVFASRLGLVLDELRLQTLAFLRLSTLASLGFQVATAVAVAAFVYMAWEVAHLSRVRLVVLLALFLRVGPRLMSLQSSMQDILMNATSFGAVRRLEREARAEAEAAPPPEPLAPLTREIRFDRVSFRYAPEAAPALDQVSFVVPAGRVTALISRSGGGKTTAADLLMGLLEPQSGAVLVDGTVLEGGRRRAFRDRVAYVPQEVFLLNDTVARNLRLGAPAATEAELWRALDEAQAAEVVRRLPEGLATEVGDRGVRLSGGERQRIALARALLRRPELLILDEATSALDWENQALIAGLISRLAGRVTVLTIAHRPSMIQFADWVVALEEGRVAETGPFAALASDPTSRLSRLLAAEGGAGEAGVSAP